MHINKKRGVINLLLHICIIACQGIAHTLIQNDIALFLLGVGRGGWGTFVSFMVVCSCCNRGGCGSVASALIFESGGSKFESYCSQHVVVSLGKTLHPKLLLRDFPQY